MGGSKIFFILVVVAFAYTLLISGPGCASDDSAPVGICQLMVHGANCPNLLTSFALPFFAIFVGLLVLPSWPVAAGPSFRVLKPPR